MRERDNSDLAAEEKIGHHAGVGDGNMHLIDEGDDRCIVEVDAPFQDGDVVGVRLADGREVARQIKSDGERKFLHSPRWALAPEPCVELQDGDRIIGRVKTMVRHFG